MSRDGWLLVAIYGGSALLMSTLMVSAVMWWVS